MKIRNGFVSNSSSSSFVMMIERSAHEKAMEAMKDDENFDLLKEIAKRMESNSTKFLGYDVVMCDGLNCHGERYMCDMEIGETEDEVFDNYMTYIPSHCVVSHGTEM